VVDNGGIGMFLPLALLVGVIGLAALFVVPWVGAPMPAAAVILVVIGLVATARTATQGPADEPRDVETPHMPGPSTSD
jgi:hypothetical protein